MVEQLVSFETAKLAKEKGFDWPVSACYDKRVMRISYSKNVFSPRNYNNSAYCYSVPTQSLLAKWLRDVHGIILYVAPFLDLYIWCIYKEISSKGGYETFEQALEEGLIEALKLIP